MIVVGIDAHKHSHTAAIVEQATGRVVRAFLSETNLEADVAVEFFLLGEQRTDMGGFEAESAP